MKRDVQGPMELIPLDIDDAYEDYMRRVVPAVPETAVQFKEGRRTWYAAMRRLLTHLTFDPRFPDKDCEAELVRLQHAMADYWKRACEDKD